MTLKDFPHSYILKSKLYACRLYFHKISFYGLWQQLVHILILKSEIHSENFLSCEEAVSLLNSQGNGVVLRLKVMLNKLHHIWAQSQASVENKTIILFNLPVTDMRFSSMSWKNMSRGVFLDPFKWQTIKAAGLREKILQKFSVLCWINVLRIIRF